MKILNMVSKNFTCPPIILKIFRPEIFMVVEISTDFDLLSIIEFQIYSFILPILQANLGKILAKMLSNCYISKLNTIYLIFKSFEMKFFLTPLTIRLVLRASVLFIIGPFVPIPDGFWDQGLIDIPFRISPKRPHKAPLYRSCMTNFFTRPLPIANYVLSTQWGGITSQFPLLRRVKQSITTINIKRMRRLYNDHNEHTVFFSDVF